MFGRDGTLHRKRQQQGSRGADERPIGSNERLAHGFDSAQIRLGRAHKVVEVVSEGEVDDTVGRCGGGPQTVEVLEVALLHVDTFRRQGGGGLVGAGQAGDLVPGLQEFVDDGRTDVSTRAGYKDTHDDPFDRFLFASPSQ